MVLWSGAKAGQIVKIETNSELAGKSLRYRLVVPVNGKVAQSDILADDDELEEYIDIDDEDDEDDDEAADDVEKVEEEEEEGTEAEEEEEEDDEY
jgi:hypothetical protein